jgi:hypothetical protein
MRNRWSCRLGLVPSLLLASILAGCKGSTAVRPAAPPVAETPPEKALLLSGKNTRVFHFVSCAYVRDIPEPELIGLATPEDAEKSGRIPCAVCRPRERFREYVKENQAAGAATRGASSGP